MFPAQVWVLAAAVLGYDWVVDEQPTTEVCLSWTRVMERLP